jgi:hypothetical protein
MRWAVIENELDAVSSPLFHIWSTFGQRHAIESSGHATAPHSTRRVPYGTSGTVARRRSVTGGKIPSSRCWMTLASVLEPGDPPCRRALHRSCLVCSFRWQSAFHNPPVLGRVPPTQGRVGVGSAVACFNGWEQVAWQTRDEASAAPGVSGSTRLRDSPSLRRQR